MVSWTKGQFVWILNLFLLLYAIYPLHLSLVSHPTMANLWSLKPSVTNVAVALPATVPNLSSTMMLRLSLSHSLNLVVHYQLGAFRMMMMKILNVLLCHMSSPSSLLCQSLSASLPCLYWPCLVSIRSPQVDVRPYSQVPNCKFWTWWFIFLVLRYGVVKIVNLLVHQLVPVW